MTTTSPDSLFSSDRTLHRFNGPRPVEEKGSRTSNVVDNLDERILSWWGDLRDRSDASSNKCHAASNKCLTSSNKKNLIRIVITSKGIY